MIIVTQTRVVVALGSPRMGGRRSRGAHHPFLPLDDVVVLLAVQRAPFPQRELVAGHQLPGALATPETLDVVNFTFRSHHEIVFAERAAAFVALGAEQFNIVPFTIRLSVPHEARAALVQKHMTLLTLQTRRVPFQIGRHPEDVLVVDLAATAHAVAQAARLFVLSATFHCTSIVSTNGVHHQTRLHQPPLVVYRQLVMHGDTARLL